MMELDMRMFARSAGLNVSYPAGSVVFNQGDAGDCMYIVQSGVMEMTIGDKVIEVCGPNEAIGFMSMIDKAPRSSSARVREAVELSIIDQRKFHFYDRRSAKLRHVYHGRNGKAHSRNESGDVAGAPESRG